MENSWLSIFATIVTTLSTLAIAFFAYQQSSINKKIYELQDRLTWFTGAMESHSQIMLQLEAENYGKELIWWDPNYEKPPFPHKHGDKATVERVMIYIDPKYRVKKLD